MRSKLPNRRAIETISFNFMGTAYSISFGRHENGNISEVFVQAGKPGSEKEALTRDIGLAISVMLQHGLLISDLLPSVTRLDDGSPAGPLGAILEHLNEEW